VVAPVDLNQLADAGSTAAWLMNPLSLGAGNPELRINHPAAKRLHRDLQPVQQSELLGGQGGAEIAVARCDQLNRFPAKLL
jgi:hypothetical protein